MGLCIFLFGLGIVIGTFSGIVLASLGKAAKDEGRKESE